MGPQAYPVNPPTSGMAITSLISGIIGWLLASIFGCINLFFGAITIGIGLICTLPLMCIPPIAWLVAIITGHAGYIAAKNGLASGSGMALAGLIMGYAGLILAILLIVILFILPLIGITIFSLPSMNQFVQPVFGTPSY